MRHLVCGLGTECVDKEDYLKVVEEKEKLGKSFDMMRNEYDIKVRQLKEKDEVIKSKNKDIDNLLDENNEKDEEIEELKNNLSYNNNWIVGLESKLKQKDEEIERVYKLNREYLAENVKLKNNNDYEELWTLKYIYDVDGVVKEYEQNGMLKEDAEELIGMDSDNWNHYSLTKEERPDKDKVIEGLLIRCESNEELIKELEEKIENVEIENRQLINDRRLKIGLSDRRP